MTPMTSDSTELKIERGADGQLLLCRDGERVPVRLSLCFPWSERGRYFSLRNEKDEELALVRELGELDASSRRAVQEALAEAGFVLRIEVILRIDRDFELYTWRVRTRQGVRRFQTRHDDWPRPLPGGGLLITDVAGDQFHIPDPAALDERSRRLLWAFAD